MTRADSPRPAATDTKPRRRRSSRPPAGYLALSERPLHILVFLLPLVALYEIGATVYLINPDNGLSETIAARSTLAAFFEAFGAVGLHLPAALLVAVLLAWHLLLRDRWRVSPPVIAGMAAESCLWTLPLLVIALLLGAGAALQVAPEAAGLHDRPWQVRLTIAIGAGLYEELLFRMILIAAVHFLLVDVLGAREFPAQAIAIGLSAIAFAAYHDTSGANPEQAASLTLFYLVSGVYFGGLYVLRGFGLVVGVHALYDVAALVLIRPQGFGP